MKKIKINHAPESVWRDPIQFIAFGFGAGAMPIAPGTFGTLIAIPLYLMMAKLNLFFYAALVLLFFLFGIYCCHVTARDVGVHDHPGIVWDEIVGYFITMFAMPVSWTWIITGFFLFRLFDIWKPWPIRLLDQHVKGGLGIMIDDVLAAIYAAIIMQVLLRVLA